MIDGVRFDVGGRAVALVGGLEKESVIPDHSLQSNAHLCIGLWGGVVMGVTVLS